MVANGFIRVTAHPGHSSGRATSDSVGKKGAKSRKAGPTGSSRPKRARRRLWILGTLVLGMLAVGYYATRMPDVVSVYGTGDPVKGAANPKVVIVEYSDFQCPACRQAQRVLKRVLARYGDQVQLVYNDFPLERVHPNAFQAAEAAQCAHRQGKFWEFHDILFEEQPVWAEDPDPLDRFLGYAREAGLDVASFEQCLKGHETRDAVQEDIREGTRLRVRSTPTFFINNTRLVGRPTFGKFQRLIEEELAQGG